MISGAIQERQISKGTEMSFLAPLSTTTELERGGCPGGNTRPVSATWLNSSERVPTTTCYIPNGGPHPPANEHPPFGRIKFIAYGGENHPHVVTGGNNPHVFPGGNNPHVVPGGNKVSTGFITKYSVKKQNNPKTNKNKFCRRRAHMFIKQRWRLDLKSGWKLTRQFGLYRIVKVTRTFMTHRSDRHEFGAVLNHTAETVRVSAPLL